MSASAPRHPVSNDLCARFAVTIVGRAAKAALASPIAADARMVVLPTWAWLPAAINLGRKDLVPRSGGQRYLMPVRLTWSQGPVLVLEGPGTTTVTFEGVGLGNHVEGSVTIDHDRREQPLVDGGTDLASSVGVVEFGRGPVRRELDRLVHDGEVGYFRCLDLIGGWLEKDLSRATRSLSMEVAEYAGLSVDEAASVIDAIGLEQVRDQMTYGPPPKPAPADGSSHVQRLIDRCLDPRAFAAVDPSLYVSQALRRDARLAVRRAINDPQIGTKMRRVARESGERDLEAILARYREAYPGDRADLGRALASLTVPPGMHVSSLDASHYEHPDRSSLHVDDEGSEAWNEANLHPVIAARRALDNDEISQVQFLNQVRLRLAQDDPRNDCSKKVLPDAS